VRADYWDFISADTVAKVWTEGFPGWATEHAGVMETSLMLHLHPDLVDMGKVPMHPPASFPPYDVYPVNPAWVPSSGALCSAKLASAENGRIFMDELERDIAKALAAEFKLSAPGHGKARRAAE
jgi:creatinine amidohydrolase